MTVSVVSAAARGDDEIVVSLEIKDSDHVQREKYVVSAALFADLGIRVGACDRELFDRICHASQVYSAEKRAVFSGEF